MAFFEIARAQQQATTARATTNENAGRWAVSQHIVETVGITAFRRAESLTFEAPFLEPPYVCTGLAIKKDMAAETGWIPDVASGVYQWERNTKGHYIGAFVFVVVRFVAAAAELQHHFLFSGMAYKDLGQTVTADAQLVEARTVGFGSV